MLSIKTYSLVWIFTSFWHCRQSILSLWVSLSFRLYRCDANRNSPNFEKKKSHILTSLLKCLLVYGTMVVYCLYWSFNTPCSLYSKGRCLILNSFNKDRESKTWFGAQLECSKQGGTLATARTPREFEQLFSLMRIANKGRCSYIGAQIPPLSTSSMYRYLSVTLVVR